MVRAGEARSAGVHRRTLLLTGVLAIGIAAAGVVWFSRSSSAPPTPPAVPPNPAEPNVSAFVERVRERVRKEPRSARTWGELGQAFIANDMEDESRVCFAEAERLDPGNPRWPYCQAGPLINRGDREAALPYLERAAELCDASEPDNQVPRLFLAETLLVLGRAETAEAHFRRVLDKQPNNERAHYGMALVAAARKDWPTSRTHLLHCLDSPYSRKKAAAQLAAISQRLGDEAGAEKYRAQAEHLPPDHDWNDPFVTEYLRWAVKKKSRYRLADALESEGRLREAADTLRPMLKDYPDDYLTALSLGKILGQMKEYRQAEQVLREALRLAPEKVQTHYYLGLVLFADAEDLVKPGGDPEQAAKLYKEAAELSRKALAIKPDYGFAYMVLGLSLNHLGQREEALTALRQAVRCNPEHAQLHFHLGKMLADAGQRDEARQQLEEAVQMAPPSAPWRQTALERLAAVRAEEKAKK